MLLNAPKHQKSSHSKKNRFHVEAALITEA